MCLAQSVWSLTCSVSMFRSFDTGVAYFHIKPVAEALKCSDIGVVSFRFIYLVTSLLMFPHSGYVERDVLCGMIPCVFQQVLKYFFFLKLFWVWI